MAVHNASMMFSHCVMSQRRSLPFWTKLHITHRYFPDLPCWKQRLVIPVKKMTREIFAVCQERCRGSISADMRALFIAALTNFVTAEQLLHEEYSQMLKKQYKRCNIENDRLEMAFTASYTIIYFILYSLICWQIFIDMLSIVASCIRRTTG